MADIRYVCLSDTHFGAYNSLLTNLKTASTEPAPLKPSPVLRRLVNCLRELLSHDENPDEKPTLVLNGDILELALATTNQAAMAFTRFVELVVPEDEDERLFDEIIFVPGNHDHHLWEVARETQYLNHINRLEPGTELPVPWHATDMFVTSSTLTVPATFLMGLINRLPHLKRKKKFITSFYPNYGITSRNGSRAVLFHHGHFIEDLYQLMSTMRNMLYPDREPPQLPWDIEAENFAWIDFFWSAMGRSGDVGEDIGLLYEQMQDEEARQRLLQNLSNSLAERYNLPGWGDWMERRIVNWLFNIVSKRVTNMERLQVTGKPLSDETQQGLWNYVEGPLKGQVEAERRGGMPSNVTFVFGHTHKPFSDDYNFRGYPEWVNTYNTGGWVVDTVDRAPLHGAAMVLLDEELNGASVRLYNEAEDADSYRVRVEQASHPGEPGNPLYEKLAEVVDPDSDPWADFSSLVATTVHKRAENLRQRINSSG